MTPHLPTHEIQVGAIIGIRVWYVKDDRLYSSIGRSRKWTPGLKQVARMLQEEGRCFFCPGKSAPCILTPWEIGGDDERVGNYQCGLHATTNMKYFPSHISPYGTSGTHNGARVVFGLVRLFGRVVEGTFGWRAEFAEVHALCDGVPSPLFHRCDDVTLTNMALRYEVPVLCLEELSAQATLIKEEPPHETI